MRNTARRKAMNTLTENGKGQYRLIKKLERDLTCHLSRKKLRKEKLRQNVLESKQNEQKMAPKGKPEGADTPLWDSFQ